MEKDAKGFVYRDCAVCGKRVEHDDNQLIVQLDNPYRFVTVHKTHAHLLKG